MTDQAPILRAFAEIEREALAAKLAQVQAGVEAGMAFYEIARAVGVAPSSITRLARSAGFELRTTLVPRC